MDHLRNHSELETQNVKEDLRTKLEAEQAKELRSQQNQSLHFLKERVKVKSIKGVPKNKIHKARCCTILKGVLDSDMRILV